MTNTKVAILISTMNRPNFMMRQLQYYTRVGSPHPIYIADSSNEQNAEALKNIISKFKDKLSISYNWYPAGLDNHKDLTAVRPILNKNLQIHYEVTNPRSPYYKDFQMVVDSFTGRDLKTKI